MIIKKLILILFSFNLYLSANALEHVKVNLAGYPKLNYFAFLLNEKSEVFIDNKKIKTKTINIFPRKKIAETDKGEELPINEINIKSNGITKIECRYGTQEYNGDFIIKKSIDNLILINKVLIGDYFSAVLGAEMGDGFSIETLKAMAICIRSYYYSKKEKYKKLDYDINNRDGLDMVYRGSGFATEKMRNAFRLTEGLFLFEKNLDIASPLFHSTSGGIILKDRALASTFNDDSNDMILLIDKDKNGKPLSINSPYFNFSIKLDEKVLRDIIKDEFVLDKIIDIKLKYITGTSCVDFIGFVDLENSVHWLKCYKFVSLAQQNGFHDFRSIQFQLSKEKEDYFFSGQGFGHLCGLSQYSAEQLAKDGAGYQEILKKYYPDFEIKKL